MIRRPAAISAASQVRARSGTAMASSISSTGPGAPPCSGPFNAPIAATTELTRSDPVDATTRAAIRADDLLFRWGGDEFLVVLSNVAEEEAARRFEAIPGVSFGLTSFGPAQPLDQAIERADSLMYEAKKQRQQV